MQSHAAAEEVAGIDTAEVHIRIRDGGIRAAPAVAGGAGLGRFQLVAENATMGRAMCMAVHRLNTFLLLGGLALLSKNEVVSAIIHGVFLAEILSVMIQVASYKLTGKRVFKMAPVHHHFELKGWPEPKIIVRFWIVAILCGGVALLGLKLR